MYLYCWYTQFFNITFLPTWLTLLISWYDSNWIFADITDLLKLLLFFLLLSDDQFNDLSIILISSVWNGVMHIFWAQKTATNNCLAEYQVQTLKGVIFIVYFTAIFWAQNVVITHFIYHWRTPEIFLLASTVFHQVFPTTLIIFTTFSAFYQLLLPSINFYQLFATSHNLWSTLSALPFVMLLIMLLKNFLIEFVIIFNNACH